MKHTRCSCRLKSIWSIKDRQKCLVVDCPKVDYYSTSINQKRQLTFSWCIRDDLGHFSLGWVLAEGAEEIAQCLSWNSACALLVEEREGLLIFC
jgi:hypothetical protein